MRLQKAPKQKRGYILVKLIDNDAFEQTKSGLFIPSQGSENDLLRKAEVVEVGADTHNYKMETKVGDIVLIKTLAVEKTDLALHVNEVPHFMMREESGFYGWV